MKNLLMSLLLAGTLSLHSAPPASKGCRACDAGKEMLRCDYFVTRGGDLSHRASCRRYAEFVDIDGAYPKAAWYYLLAGDPARAEAAARKGIEQGQGYAREYRAMALWLMGRRLEARRELALYRRLLPSSEDPKRHLIVLHRLYPDSGIERLEEKR